MSFSLDLSKFPEAATETNEDIIRGTAIALFAAIINDTPVDTGRARGNWFATGQKESVKITTDTDKAGESTKAKMTAKIRSLSNVEIIQLTNNLPYIKKLEDGGYPDGPKIVNGYSRKAPAGMVKVNIARFESLLKEEAARRKI